jgi:hypothetical protein
MTWRAIGSATSGGLVWASHELVTVSMLIYTAAFAEVKILAQPKASSTHLRMRWETAEPG